MAALVELAWLVEVAALEVVAIVAVAVAVHSTCWEEDPDGTLEHHHRSDSSPLLVAAPEEAALAEHNRDDSHKQPLVEEHHKGQDVAVAVNIAAVAASIVAAADFAEPSA